MSDPTHAPAEPVRTDDAADLCAEVRESLGTIAQALAKLREEIDAVLHDTAS